MVVCFLLQMLIVVATVPTGLIANLYCTEMFRAIVVQDACRRA